MKKISRSEKSMKTNKAEQQVGGEPLFSNLKGDATMSCSPPVPSPSDKALGAKDPDEIPKWYQYFAKARKRREMIKELLEDYANPNNYAGCKYEPSQEDLNEYAQQLKKLKLRELGLMYNGFMKSSHIKLDKLDRIKSINKKKHAAVTIFMDNDTMDTGVIHCYARTFRRGKMTYIVVPSKGKMNPEFKMMHFHYFANVPFPVEIKKGDIKCEVDSKLLDSVIEFKVLEALANIDVTSKVNFILFFVILTFVMIVADLIIDMKSSGII